MEDKNVFTREDILSAFRHGINVGICLEDKTFGTEDDFIQAAEEKANDYLGDDPNLEDYIFYTCGDFLIGKGKPLCMVCGKPTSGALMHVPCSMKSAAEVYEKKKG